MKKKQLIMLTWLTLMLIWSACKEKNQAIQDIGTDQVLVVNTFDKAHLAFTDANPQSKTQTFKFPTNLSNVSKIKMYVKLECPQGGCGAWDVYANVFIKDSQSGAYFELGRYITPYGVDNHQRAKGFEFDVTDFKSLLTGDVELKVFAETWTKEGWLVTVKFEYEQGTPDYQYYAITPIMQYNKNSLEGIPYGVTNNFKTDFGLKIPANAKQTKLRTIISGWGHAAIGTANGNCAEWCPRTHNIFIDGQQKFAHVMGPIGCGSNPVQPQGGNWAPNRAGWCPGMEVPIRSDIFATPEAGKTLRFKYTLQPWTNTDPNSQAFYAISSFIVVKSDQLIATPEVVTN